MIALTSNDGGGSFRELRERHLPLFDEAVHRHDRGWPHEPPEAQMDRPKGEQGQRQKRGWKRVGILHFQEDHDEG